MRSKLTKTIILIVFVVFLGIKNVSALTCTYSRNVSGEEQTYTINLTTKAVTYTYFRIPMAEPQTTNKTMVFSFTTCPPSITVTGNTIADGGSSGDYKLKTPTSSSSSSSNLEYGGGVGQLTHESNVTNCGSITDIPSAIPKTTKIIYMFLQVLIPVILVIMGMLDLTKGVMSQKEDEIKRGQQTLVKRLIAAAMVFFVFALVKMLVSFVSDGNTTVTDCLNCFISGECDDTVPPVEGEESSSTMVLEWNESSDAQIAMVS